MSEVTKNKVIKEIEDFDLNYKTAISHANLDYLFKTIEAQRQEIERLNKRTEELNIINEEHRELNGMIRKELEIEKDISDGMLKTIDKAIEYLKKHGDYNIKWGGCTEELGYDKCNELLEILDKGSDEISK